MWREATSMGGSGSLRDEGDSVPGGGGGGGPGGGGGGGGGERMGGRRLKESPAGSRR